MYVQKYIYIYIYRLEAGVIEGIKGLGILILPECWRTKWITWNINTESGRMLGFIDLFK